MQRTSATNKDGIKKLYLRYQDAFERRGYSKKRNGIFVREFEDGVLGGAYISQLKRHGMLFLEPGYCVLHRPVGIIVEDGLALSALDPAYFRRNHRSVRDVLALRMMVDLLRDFGIRRSFLDYASKTEKDAAAVLELVLRDFEFVVARLGRRFDSLVELSRVLVEAPYKWGGTAGRIKLAAIYYFLGQIENCEKLLSDLASDSATPMERRFAYYLHSRLEAGEILR